MAGTVIIALLLVATFISPVFAEHRALYLATFISLVFANMINHFFVKPRNKNCLPLLYFLLTGVDLFASLLGTYEVFGRNGNATTICVFLTVLPVFVIDKPKRVSVINFIQWIIFSILTFCFKDSTLAVKDMVNAFLFLLCSFFITYQNVHIKLENIITKVQLKQQRDSDFLTKLHNRGALEKRVNRALEEEIESSAMLLLDIDNFKNVNDTFGHDKGDEVLVMTAEKLKNVFSERAVISRVGGDEFIVFIPDTIEMTELMKKMSMALEIMKFEIASEKRRSQVSASMGATLITSNNVNYEMLYKQADIAIYQAKRNGKCGYAIYQTMK